MKMDFLSIKDSNASRPSLISSVWSLQVQPQQDTTTIMDIPMGSQQSLPDLMPSTVMEVDCHKSDVAQDQANTIRRSNSLSQLSQFFKDSRTFRIHEAPSFVWKRQSQQQSPSSQFRSLVQQDSVLSRQQKEKNICEWLEQLNCNDEGPRSSETIFTSQLNSPSTVLKPPSQFPRTPMEH